MIWLRRRNVSVAACWSVRYAQKTTIDQRLSKDAARQIQFCKSQAKVVCCYRRTEKTVDNMYKKGRENGEVDQKQGS